MTNRTAANRYARALLDIAVKEHGDLQKIELELAAFAGLFTEHPALEKVLLNPAVPVSRKQALVGELAKIVTTEPILGKLLGLLASRDRLVLVRDLLAAYRDRLLDHHHVVRAEVTTATELPADRARAIE